MDYRPENSRESANVTDVRAAQAAAGDCQHILTSIANSIRDMPDVSRQTRDSAGFTALAVDMFALGLDHGGLEKAWMDLRDLLQNDPVLRRDWLVNYTAAPGAGPRYNDVAIGPERAEALLARLKTELRKEGLLPGPDIERNGNAPATGLSWPESQH